MYYNEKKMFKRLFKYSEYSTIPSEFCFTYDFGAIELNVIKENNRLDEFGDINKLNTMCEIMHYVSKKLYQPDKKMKMSNIQNFSALTIDEMMESGCYKPSCWVNAVYLQECFLAMKIPARMVRCLSGLKFDKECHCVTVAYCGEFNKYVLFDVANNSVYYSNNGIPLDLNEFRECIIQQKRFFYIQTKANEKKNLIKYWLKNLVIFQCYENQRYGNELEKRNNTVINLVPANLKIRNNLFSNYEGIPIIITQNNIQFWKI